MFLQQQAGEAMKLKDGDTCELLAADPQLTFHAKLVHYFICLHPFDEKSISAGSVSSSPRPVMSQRALIPL